MLPNLKANLRIGLIGDFNPQVKAHSAIPRALSLAAQSARCELELVWLPTPSLHSTSESLLATFDRLWCVPGSPYADLAGALQAIQFARTRPIPFLGTCGGFQHAVLEYARNVLGWSDADHAESSPAAALPLIAPLTCPLVGLRGSIRLLAGSQAARIYGRQEIVENYHCNFGVNPRFQSQLEQGALKISGVDANGETRVIELSDHPFFMATLFQPELSALEGEAHPLVIAFLRAPGFPG
jgi:CTP synthase (UTP-ammonia lyase)